MNVMGLRSINDSITIIIIIIIRIFVQGRDP